MDGTPEPDSDLCLTRITDALKVLRSDFNDVRVAMKKLYNQDIEDEDEDDEDEEDEDDEDEDEDEDDVTGKEAEKKETKDEKVGAAAETEKNGTVKPEAAKVASA